MNTFFSYRDSILVYCALSMHEDYSSALSRKQKNGILAAYSFGAKSSNSYNCNIRYFIRISYLEDS